MSIMARVAAARTAFTSNGDLVRIDLVRTVLNTVETGARQAEQRLASQTLATWDADATRAKTLRETAFDIRATFGWEQTPATSPARTTDPQPDGFERALTPRGATPLAARPVRPAAPSTRAPLTASTPAVQSSPMSLGDYNGRIAEARAQLLSLEDAREAAYRQLAAA